MCPLTFYHPALLAKRAAAVAELSGGRLDLGIGAGWHEGEHAMFGIPFPPLKERMDRFECGARVDPRAVAGPARHARAAVLSAARGAVLPAAARRRACR